MINFKSSIAYFPSKKEEQNCDGYYFNSKVLDALTDGTKVKLSQKTAKSGRQIFAVCTGNYENDLNKKPVYAALDKLKKYHAFYVKKQDANIEKLLKNYFKEASLDVAASCEGTVTLPKVSMALVALDEKTLTVANVGNVKVFAVKNGVVSEISTEHTQAKKMADMGIISQQKVKVHPQRKRVTRYLGGGTDLANPSINTINCSGNETFVILSGAFYDFVDDKIITEAVLSSNEPNDIAGYVMSACNNEEVGDFTVITVKAYSDEDAPAVVVAPIAEATVAPVISETPISIEEPTEPETPVEAEIPAEPETPVSVEFPAEPEIPVSVEMPAEPEKTEDKPMLLFDISDDDDVKIAGNSDLDIVVVENATEDEDDDVKLADLTKLTDTIEDKNDDSKEVWPTVIIFVISLVILVLLFFFGIKMLKSKNDKKPETTEKPISTAEQTEVPEETAEPTAEATSKPADETQNPGETSKPTENVTKAPTAAPTKAPTAAPTKAPTAAPATATPEVTSTPESTETEEATATPEATEDVEPTETPEATEVVEPTEVPETATPEAPTASPEVTEENSEETI